MEKAAEKPVFTLVPGHYHGPWVFNKYLRKRLASQGFDCITPDLPIEDPDATLDDHAEIIRKAEAERGAANYINVGHSWGGDVIYRKLGATVSHLIYVAAPLRPVLANVEVLSSSVLSETSRGLLYHTWLLAEEEGHLQFDPDLLGHAFYNHIKQTKLKSWAIDQLRPHPHTPQSPMAQLPDIKMDYIGCRDDWAFRFRHQRETAKVLGLNYTEINSDHTPMLSHPKMLANRLIKLATNEGWGGRPAEAGVTA